METPMWGPIQGFHPRGLCGRAPTRGSWLEDRTRVRTRGRPPAAPWRAQTTPPSRAGRITLRGPGGRSPARCHHGSIGRRVLDVDDDPSLRTFARRVLEADGLN